MRTNWGSLTKKLFAPTPRRGDERNIFIAAKLRLILLITPGEFGKFDIRYLIFDISERSGGIIKEIKIIMAKIRGIVISSFFLRVLGRYKKVISKATTSADRLAVIKIVPIKIINIIANKKLVKLNARACFFTNLPIDDAGMGDLGFVDFKDNKRGRVAVRKAARTFGWGKVAYGLSRATFKNVARAIPGVDKVKLRSPIQ